MHEIYTGFVKCDFCPSIVKVNNYRSHVQKAHNHNLSKDFDLNKKHDNDIEIVQKILLQNQSNRSKYHQWEIQIQQQEEVKRQRKAEQKRKEEERIKKLEQEKEEEYERNMKNIAIIWDEIIFKKDYIEFNTTSRKVIIKPFYCKGLIESLNHIKEEYFKRIYSKKVYQLVVYKGEIIRERSKGLVKLLETIEVVKDFHRFKLPDAETKIKIKEFGSLNNEEVLDIFQSFIKKNQYLKYLACEHDSTYKIIALHEYVNNKSEEALLFRLKTQNGNIVLVWENVNEARASHVFTFKQADEESALDEIKYFVCSGDLINKRSSLYLKSTDAIKLKNSLHYSKSIKHNNLDDYKIEIERLLRLL